MSTAILIVENEQSTRESLVKALSPSYTVFQACNGVEALEVLHGHGEITIVLTDLVMPVMGGDELIQILNSWNRPISTVLMTASELDSREITMLHRLADFFLPKPIELPLLESVIQALLDERNEVVCRGDSVNQ
jgi:CheY-like chemotaxis protein